MKAPAIVLFDADGVVQQPAPNWHDTWGSLIHDATQAGEFLQDIFKAEAPFLDGRLGLEQAVAEVLTRWQSPKTVEDALALWNRIETRPEALDLVARVRRSGTPVGLATNQHPFRFAYMRDELGYAEQFDHLFASCVLGVSKPSPTYFEAIRNQLGLAVADMLFIDDHPANVEAARAVGLRAETYHLKEGIPRLAHLLQQQGLEV